MGEGDRYGEPVVLREWQKRIIWRVYEFYPETQARRYKRCLVGMGKGNGKSPLASWIGAYELLGGVNPYPHVIIGAASLKQANLVFGDLKATITGPDDNPSPLKPFVEAFELEVQIKGMPGIAERIAAEAGTNDGARATAFIADELHEWDGRRERVYLIADGAIAKRKNAFSFAISTAGVRGSSLLERLYEEGKKVASGELVDDTYLFEWWEAPDSLDLDDEQDWLEAVYCANPAAGDFNDIEQIRSRFHRIPRYEWTRYHANRFTHVESQWLPPGLWETLSGSGDGRVCLAFRGAYDNSQASLVACTTSGHLRVLGSWEGGEDYQVPRSEVEARISKAMKELDVSRFAYDPLGWYEEGERWSQEYGDRTAVRFETRKTASFAAACSKFYTAVVSGQVSHDGSPVLSRHLKNAQPRETKDGTYIATGRSETACAIAAVIAYDQAMGMPQRKGGFVGVTL